MRDRTRLLGRPVARRNRHTLGAAAGHREVARAHGLSTHARRRRGSEMTIRHHLGAHSLMSFAAGALPSALAAVAGAHLAMCARCRRDLELFEHLGGAVLEGLAPVPL